MNIRCFGTRQMDQIITRATTQFSEFIQLIGFDVADLILLYKCIKKKKNQMHFCMES